MQPTMIQAFIRAHWNIYTDAQTWSHHNALRGCQTTSRIVKGVNALISRNFTVHARAGVYSESCWEYCFQKKLTFLNYNYNSRLSIGFLNCFQFMINNAVQMIEKLRVKAWCMCISDDVNRCQLLSALNNSTITLKQLFFASKCAIGFFTFEIQRIIRVTYSLLFLCCFSHTDIHRKHLILILKFDSNLIR